jgi:hypothetical protein
MCALLTLSVMNCPSCNVGFPTVMEVTKFTTQVQKPLS